MSERAGHRVESFGEVEGRISSMNLKMIDARAASGERAAASTVGTDGEERREDDGMPRRFLGHSSPKPARARRPRSRPSGRLAFLRLSCDKIRGAFKMTCVVVVRPSASLPPPSPLILSSVRAPKPNSPIPIIIPSAPAPLSSSSCAQK